MNGILCINKPQEYTSFDVVARLRGMSKTKRVGHSGTLDPMATGVLPIFIGNATKACDMLEDDDKSYIAEFKFGVTTDTLDSSGEVLSSCKSMVTAEQICELLPQFRGEIEQIPPMYSAIRVNGQRLYDLARQGREVERKSRKVTIKELLLTNFDAATQTGSFSIACTKGTYIRTIISDIGDLLGVGGIMTNLVRTKACGFLLENCITLEQAQQLTIDGELENALMEVDELFRHLPKIVLSAVQSTMFKNGVKLDLNRVNYENIDTQHRIYDSTYLFLGIAHLKFSTMELVVDKMFYRAD